jgi:hypothetical protein
MPGEDVVPIVPAEPLAKMKPPPAPFKPQPVAVVNDPYV